MYEYEWSVKESAPTHSSLTPPENSDFLILQVYSLEKVLEHVRHWNDSVQSPQSTFYLFVLNSLLGFGTDARPGRFLSWT